MDTSDRRQASDEVPELELGSVEDRRPRGAWLVSAALIGLIGLATLAVGSIGRGTRGDEAGPDRSDDAPDEEPIDAPDLAVGGPRDGLDSKGHPVLVSPADGLVDGQHVTVSGAQFPPDVALGVVMCSGAVERGGGSAQCQLSPFTQVQSDPAGSFEVEFPVRRFVRLGHEEIDCAAPPPEGVPTTCVVAVGAISDYDESGFVNVVFDASVPAPQPPVVSAVPTTDLADGDMVAVSVSGLPDDLYWWPMICADIEGEVWCDDAVWPADGPIEQFGDGTVEIRASRVILEWYEPGPIDCAEYAGRCYLYVWGGDRLIEPVPISFATW